MTRTAITVEDAIERLAVAVHNCEVCQKELDHEGAVTSAHADHPPRRRTVHSMSVGGGFGFGADWDEADVHEWLHNATEVVDTGGWMGHGVAAVGMDKAPSGVHNPKDYEKRTWYAFETKKGEA